MENALSERLIPWRVEGLPSSYCPSRRDDGIVVGMPFTYILRCAGDYLYVGATDDLESRLRKHHEGTASVQTASRHC